MKTIEKLFAIGSTMFLVAGLVQCSPAPTNQPPDMTMTQPDMAMLGAPTVTQVTPATAVNNVMTPLTLTGTNFRAGATVQVGGVACTQVTVVSPTQITCTYPGKATTCGGQAIVVTHPDDMKMGTLPTAMGLKLRSAALGFAAPANLTTGNMPDHVVAADFNADGKLDLANTNRSGTVQVRLGVGDGTFMTPTNITTGATVPIGLVVVDLNADTKPDLVYTTNAGVSVLLNMGGGTFAAPANTAIAGNPDDVVVSDFNKDGKADVAVALNQGNAVAIRLGDGAGGFQATLPPNVGVGITPVNVVAGDFNGDGKSDLAVANFADVTVSLRPGNGDGTFGAGTNMAVVAQPVGMALVDVNGDSKLDLLVSGQAGSAVGLYLGNGTGGFGAVMNQPTGLNPRSVTLGDIDGDGKLDFASANFGTTTVSLRLGNGTAFTGGGTQDYPVGTTPFTVAVGDVNGDGLVDMVSANNGSNNLSVLLQQCK